MNSRKVLGRGLDSLIPQDGVVGMAPGRSADALPAGQAVHWVPVELILPNPRQPRTVMDDARLDDLARSIQEKGILEPLLVRPSTDGVYELVAGERRLRAAQRAGRTEVPVLFRDLDERASLEIALIENIQREDLNPVDEARAYQRLADEFGRTHADISREVGKDRSTITNMLRLLRLPDEVLDLVSRGTISVGHARVLLAVEDAARQIEMAKQMADLGWSVREAERRVAEEPSSQAKRRETQAPAPRDRQVERVEEALQYAFATPVKLTHGPGGGKIEIRYHSDAELERILDILGIEIH